MEEPCYLKKIFLTTGLRESNNVVRQYFGFIIFNICLFKTIEFFPWVQNDPLLKTAIAANVSKQLLLAARAL